MEARKELINEISILQALFEASPAAIMVVDKRTSILMVNRELEQLTGFTRQELNGQRKWADLVLSEDRHILKNLMRLLQSSKDGVPTKYECRFVDKHGALKTVFISGAYLKGEELIILSLINITEHKETERMLKSAVSKAESSDRLKTAFLGNLSHEIRTPMNAIMGFASLLQMDELSGEKKKLYLAQIVNGSTDLLQLIEKTITISRIDLGQIKINRRQFFLNRRLNEIRVKYQNILDSSGKEHVKVVVEMGRQEEDFVIQADGLRIMEVLNNLLENAVKFTESGQIAVGYSYLEEETENAFDSLLFYVKDTGIGISKELTGIVFDRFVKLVDKNETVLRGAGLGLAISRDLVKLMQGDIWVETEVGKGSKFYFTIPITYSKSQESDIAAPKTRKAYDDWSCFELLVAEDMESNYLYIKELLSPCKINILRARDGLEAVEIFEKHPNIDVVLMDILMPGLDGYEATTKIRSLRQDVPVIAQTAFTFEGEMQNGLYAGCFTDYIMKPFTRDMLMANLKKHLAAR